MIVEIQKSEIEGKIKAPPSKSYTHRALILAALAKGKSKIISPLISEDTQATLDCLRKIGVKIKKRGNLFEIQGGNFSEPKEPLFCRESGTTLRLMTAVSSLVKGRCLLIGEKSLMARPIKPLISALKRLGVKCALKENFIVVENNLLGGKTEIRGDISSQFLSALLLISPLAKKGVEIKLITPLESKPYLLMTIEAQKKFGVKINPVRNFSRQSTFNNNFAVKISNGVNYSKDLRRFFVKKQSYKPTKFLVEGDWSSVAPFLAAGVIAGKVEIKNLNLKSLQADKKIIEILEKMGAKTEIKKSSFIVQKSELKPIKIDLRDSPDLFPITCALAALAKGKSEISGIGRLKIKESNRIEEMKKGLSKMEIKNYQKGNRFFIKGSEPKGTEISSTDHRILMAFGILGLVAKGKTIIKNPQCVKKSFPQFWQELKKIKANLKFI